MLKKTYSPKLAEIEHRWYVLDAAGIPLGRLSSLVARLLMGKHKPTYATHIDTGDFVVVINAEQAVLTGGKEEKKIYHYHTGYPGGIKSETAAKRRAAPADEVGRGGGLGHAPQGSARPQAAPQAQGLRGPRAPAPGAAARELRRRRGSVSPKREFGT